MVVVLMHATHVGSGVCMCVPVPVSVSKKLEMLSIQKLCPANYIKGLSKAVSYWSHTSKVNREEPFIHDGHCIPIYTAAPHVLMDTLLQHSS